MLFFFSSFEQKKKEKAIRGLSSIPLKANTLQPGENLKIKCTNGRNIKQRVGGTKTFLWSDDGPRWISLRNAACRPLNHSSASEARPTISEKCPFPGGDRNRSLFSKFIEFLNKNHLQSLRIPTNVSSFWNQQELEKLAVPDKTSCCTDSSLCSPGTPGPPSPHSNKTHGTGHLCGNNKPNNRVWTRLVGLRGVYLKPPSLRDAAFDGFYLVERNNVCLSDDLVLGHYKESY